jgi:hypothetical protein
MSDTANTIINGYINKFGNSKPIFKVVKEYGTELRLRPKDPYKPDPSGITDPIELAIIDRYSEYYDKTTRQYKNDISGQRIYDEIVRAMLNFYQTYSPLKSPRQSKTYKWLSYMDRKYNDKSSAGIIYLWRYGREHNPSSKTNPHAINMLAILEKMREKYDR